MIKSTFKKYDVVSVKTMAGHELVASFLEEDEETYTLKTILMVMLVPQPEGNLASTFYPYLTGVDDHTPVKLRKDALQTVLVSSNAEMSKNYTEATSSIITA